MPHSIHKSVGAIIIKRDKILLINRSTFPEGLAYPAGHIEKNESPTKALIREVKEETNLTLTKYTLIGEEIVKNTPCNKGSDVHHWFIFSCNAKGKIKNNSEAKSISWVNISELKNLRINETWRYWLKKFKYL